MMKMTIIMRELLRLCVACAVLLAVGILGTAASSFAQQGTPSAAPSAPAAAQPQAPTPPVASPSSPAPATSAPVPAPPAVISDPAAPKPLVETSYGQTLELKAKPALVYSGSSDWDDGFSAISEAMKKINAEIKRLNLQADGLPMTMFVETDDQGFRFEAIVPVAALSAEGTSLTGGIKIGKTPAGKAMRFEYRGDYDDIDSTYEAITAYLDEKGFDAQNQFVEEYVTDLRAARDTGLQINIYVFMR